VNYDNTVVPDYLYRLDGPVSEKWATGGTDFSKEYTSLPEGHYTFHVCAISGDNERVEDSISFDILPPWYRTWWSYIIYLLIAALIVWYTYMRIIGIHRQILLQKELELRCQKLELQKDNEQKSETISMLRDEKLQTELRFKSEELLSATLNVMRKNEMLQSIEKEVNGVIHSIDNEDLTKIRRKMVCLKGLINNNMAHDGDLQTFQDSFDFIHHNFFKILSTMFPTLTKREKMLCAYIKMNLSTKEIAPLLNISPRGVEISRFRLRKKLNLNDGENLAVFLQSIGE
jgi:DNA-binding NarL/FixJ family response regulator